MAAKKEEQQIKIIKIKNYEVFTCSGRRIVISATDVLTFVEAREVIFYTANGSTAASFNFDNIEGWRVLDEKSVHDLR